VGGLHTVIIRML